MKLIKCPKCKSKININEKECPFCHEPIKKKIEIKHVIIIIVIASLIGYNSIIGMKETKINNNINLKKMYCTKINNSNNFVSCVLLYNYKSYLNKGTESYDGNDTTITINKHKYKIYSIDDNTIKTLKKKKYTYAMISSKKINNLSKKNNINLVAEIAVSKKDIANISDKSKIKLKFIINKKEISKEFKIKNIEYKEYNNYNTLYKDL
ncbi:MAG: hypothetical protein VZS44_02120 [Bacilli bacterium]|nr:hypothetical protein [Bacilli bacterium]